jgi:hypothetical protein
MQGEICNFDFSRPALNLSRFSHQREMRLKSNLMLCVVFNYLDNLLSDSLNCFASPFFSSVQLTVG